MTKTKSPIIATLNQLAKVQNNPTISMMVLTAKQLLRAGKVDFSKVLKMVDDMVALLKQEADDDLKARDDCNVQLNDNEDSLKEVGHAIKGLAAQIEDAASTIAAQVSAIDKNSNEIAAANKAMAEATEQRKAENAEFVELVALNKDAVELIMKAKDKLNSFYNPDLVREVPVEEAAKEALLQGDAPEIFEGERKNKGQKSGNVLQLMDSIATDLNNDTKDKEHSEQTAQTDYEKLSVALKQQVADCSKALAQAQQTKANSESEKQTFESTLDMKTEEETDIKKTIADLHARCDFILNAFEERKTARENEIAGLQKAKAVLKGAKFD